jgi:uncharacterized membrane protein YhiD involved in acid resistance
MGAGAGLYRVAGAATVLVLLALSGLIYVENLLKLKGRYMLFRISSTDATDMVPEVHRIFTELKVQIDNFQVSSAGEKHVIQFDADVTHRQQEQVFTAITRPGLSIEMFPVERQQD